MLTRIKPEDLNASRRRMARVPHVVLHLTGLGFLGISEGMAANMQVVNSTPRTGPAMAVAHASSMFPSHSVGPCWHVTTPPDVWPG